jgi:hypothetical protein
VKKIINKLIKLRFKIYLSDSTISNHHKYFGSLSNGGGDRETRKRIVTGKQEKGLSTSTLSSDEGLVLAEEEDFDMDLDADR